ncbi:unnamed protein product [Caenorhabditis bovis]|uniref:Peptidase metallopeptidase domain-containing protein n=1 Tax=Caenorhabditis bovis TaxID=2654633 RepID=A0A8S1E7S6_9PELO|nr:unnamed protein product [Caenorhabditis bovis]
MRWRLSIAIFLILTISLCEAGFFDSLVSKFTGKGSSSSSSSSSNNNNNNNNINNNRRNPPPVTEEKARKYLQSFGYVPPSNSMGAGRGMAADFGSAESIFKSAIKKFQEFAGLAKTGILDTATKAKMALARCGVTDAPQALTAGSASQFKWSKTRLTYSIENFSPDLPRDSVRRAIAEAYGLWAKVTPLTFEEVPAGGNADIKVRFGANNHNDPWPFDGKGGVLAHATMPESGMLHFDEDENWAYMDTQKIGSDYTDFLSVAIHEGGHTLGLEHSRDENAVMAPFYQPTVDNSGRYNYPNLKSDDISAIQAIYGPNRGGSSSGGGSFFTTPRTPTTTTKSWFNRFFGHDDDDEVMTTTRRPVTRTTQRMTTYWPSTEAPRGGSGFGGGGSGSGSNCPYSIDAYTPSDSFSYAFSGSSVYVISGVRVTKVQRISELFPSAPVPVQGAVFNTNAGSLLLFGNNKVYSYYYSCIRGIYQLDSGYPKSLPSDLGFRVSGALRWINGHQILMGDNEQFAVYDEFWNQATLKNRVASYFPNLPRGVKGIESPSGMTVTAFTSSQVFEYNSRQKTIGRQSSLANYLVC